jgi:phosphoserine phosphatase RsbU/P
MRILIAEDDDVSRRALGTILRTRGHVIEEAADGLAAWQALQTPDPPGLLVLDWLMPGMEGLELCHRARSDPRLRSLYIVLVTSYGTKEHILAGLRAGANDFITKPYDPDELEARINVGAQVVQLQRELAHRVHELEDALARVSQLQGLLPICCYCKKIRDDQDYWHQVESYLARHSQAQFSHSICPDCYRDQVEPELERLREAMEREHHPA